MCWRIDKNHRVGCAQIIGLIISKNSTIKCSVQEISAEVKQFVFQLRDTCSDFSVFDLCSLDIYVAAKWWPTA